MHDWKVGDKFTLEFEVVGYAGVGFIMAKGAGFNLIIGDEMREAKLIQPKPEKPKPEIKVGQVWRTRGGREVNVPRFTKSDDYPVVCAYGEKEYVVSPSGKWSSHVDSAFDLVELVQDAPEPQKLDVTKPMRVIADSVLSITYVAFDPVMNMIYVRYPNGRIDCYPPEELENIPEPKRTTTQIVELVNFDFGQRIMMQSDGAFYVNVASRAKVSHTEGEGWSIEEVL